MQGFEDIQFSKPFIFRNPKLMGLMVTLTGVFHLAKREAENLFSRTIISLHPDTHIVYISPIANPNSKAAYRHWRYMAPNHLSNLQTDVAVSNALFKQNLEPLVIAIKLAAAGLE